MGLLGRGRSKGKGKEDETMAAGPAEDLPLDEATKESEREAATPELTISEGPESASGMVETGSLEGLIDDADLQEDDGEALDVDDDAAPQQEGDDGLMDIFSSEVEDDVDLSALTEGLEELSAQSLLDEARRISADLSEFLGES